MIKAIIVGFLGLVFGLSAFEFWTQTSSCEEDVYSKVDFLGGIVTTTEGESKEESKAANRIILLQRNDCKKCISSVRTDNEGRYGIWLATGKYQIFVRECGKNKNEDCLAPGQTRFVEVKRNNDDFQFDIKLIHSKDDGAMKLPKGMVAPTPQ